jgi:dipeptidyl aminopeptidase/acylaminoacyl peptidase
VGAIVGRSFWAEYQCFHQPRAKVDTASAQQAIGQLRDVTFTTNGGVLHGWYAPGTQRAAVLLLHGTGGSRQDLLPEMGILAKRGISVLALDLPGHGQSDGESHWDEPERQATRAAVDFLAKQQEVDPNRIGAFGFSLGSYTALQVAATDRRLKAIAVAGAPPNVADHARYEYGTLGTWGALLAMRVSGMKFDELIPEQIVAQWTPRPLLVIEGEQDEVVPTSLARRLYDAAKQPKEWLLVPGAHHGDYASVAPELYGNRLGDFFVRSLLVDVDETETPEPAEATHARRVPQKPPQVIQ